MTITRVLAHQRALLRPSEETLTSLKKISDLFVRELRREFVRARAKAQVFIGGSFAKGTLVTKDEYDIDIFVRFADAAQMKSLESIVKRVAHLHRWRVERIHGSRDYTRVIVDGTYPVTLEVVPVLAIKKPENAENVTDLSYFHVAYVMKKSRRLADDIRLAKEFCRAQGIYGAESYIEGFSGYSLECLIIYYNGFVRFLRALSSVSERIVLDPAHHYRTGHDALLSLNESKTRSPVVLVDPTCKERNVLAALKAESFATFQKAARAFLARPSARFFSPLIQTRDNLRAGAAKKKQLFATIDLVTDRQAGDIAGTKLKRCAQFLVRELSRWFEATHVFHYTGGQSASLHFIYKPKAFEIRRGPPASMTGDVKIFKKHHTRTFTEKGYVWTRIALKQTLPSALKEITRNREQLYRMGLVDFKIED